MVVRSKPPTDPRQYVRISVDIIANPKLDAIDDPAAGWAHVHAIVYCAQSLTDGHFSPRKVLSRAGVDPKLLDALVAEDLWHLPGHDCPECPQPREGFAYVHDYLKHQRSAAEVRELTEARSAAGSKGAESRWGKPDAKRTTGKANAMASAKQVPRQTDGNVMAEKRRGEKNEPPSEVLFDAPPAASPAKTTKTTKRSTAGTTIPDDFAMTEGMRNWARGKQFPFDVELETERFINYWQARSGKEAEKRNWDAAWRTWMLNDRYRAPAPAPQGHRSGPPAGYPDRNQVAVRDVQPRQSAGERKYLAAQAVRAELDAELAHGSAR